MELGELITLMIVAGLVTAIVISVLLGYGRRISRGWKSLGWLVVVAMLAVPVLLYTAGGLLPKADRAEPSFESVEETADAAAEPEELVEETAAEEADVAEAVEEADEATETVAPAAPSSIETPVPTSAPKRGIGEERKITTGERRKGVAVGERARTAPTAVPEPVESEYSSLEAQPEAVVVEPEAISTFETNEKFDTVKILFGTDRRQDTSVERVSFGADRAGELTLGQASITIPKQHTRGIVERPWEISIVGITIYKQKEDPEKHFTVQKIGVLDEDAFVSAANAQLAASKTYRKQAAIFVHGYNNDFDTALYRSAQMAYDMGFDGAPFLYSWPSAAGYSTYEYDQQSARQSIVHLRRFIRLVTERTNAEKIHLVAHSMGNDVLLEALRELRFQFGPDHDYKISQVILAAPDVDRNVFENLARQIAGISNGITLYASANDRALQASRTYAGGIARAGDVPEQGPVVIDGVDTIDVSETQQDFWGLNHNTYAETSELLHDIRKIFLTGVRPPKTRTPTLEPVALSQGTYWRFPGSP